LHLFFSRSESDSEHNCFSKNILNTNNLIRRNIGRGGIVQSGNFPAA